jgi:hypothetical protein
MVEQVMANSYNKSFQLCSMYSLDPGTWGVFDLIFRNYIVLKLQKVLASCSISKGREVPSAVVSKVKILKADSLLCLRMAIKMRENQVEMYRRTF